VNVAGVDTHKDTHVAAVLGPLGQVMGTSTFPSTARGHRQLLGWVRSFGPIDQIGVEGTGSWGKGLARVLAAGDLQVIEVTRPNRQLRRKHGKSDITDAIAAAVAVLNRTATAVAKTGDGPAESLRMVHNARESAVKARTAAINEFHAQVVTAPEPIRTKLRDLNITTAIRTAARYRVDDTALTTDSVARSTLRTVAQRIARLDAEIAQLEHQRKKLLDAHTPPSLRQRCGVGDFVAAQLLITAGDNPHRLHSEASLAALCGTSCVEASSGNTRRHRLNRGGDRQANRALHTVVITRMRHDPRTKAYVARRTTEGKSRKEIIRCLKRYIARELYTELTRPLT
jgi:transposase